MENDRTQHLGSTDLAPAMNLSKFKNAVQLFNEKTGRAPSEGDKSIFRRGAILEKPVWDLMVESGKYKAYTGCTYQPGLREYGKFPYMAGHVDGIATADGIPVCIEIKTYQKLPKDKPADLLLWLKLEHPDAFVQAQHHMVCWEKLRTDVVIYDPISFQPWDIVEVPRHEVFIPKAIRAAEVFKAAVDSDNPAALPMEGAPPLEEVKLTPLDDSIKSELATLLQVYTKVKKEVALYEETEAKIKELANKLGLPEIVTEYGVIKTRPNKPQLRLNMDLLKAKLPAEFDFEACKAPTEVANPFVVTIKAKGE